MSTPKRHHYVPEFINWHFVGPDGNASVWFKEDGAIRPIPPKNLFVVGHLYSEIDRHGGKNPDFEIRLGRMEGVFSPIIRDIIDGMRGGTGFELTVQQKRALDFFIYLQFKRVPDRFETHKTEVGFDALLRKEMDDWAAKNPDRAHELQTIEFAKASERVFRNSRIKAIRDTSGPVLPEMAKHGLDVAQISPVVNAQFVLGSNPVVAFQGLVEHDVVQLWMPIAPDIAIGLGPVGSEVRECLCLDRDTIERFNDAVCAQSTLVASRSEALLQARKGA